MADPLRLYGLRALVTSGGSGIGEAVARTLVKHGARVLAADTVNSGVDHHFRSVKGIDGLTANLVDPAKVPELVDEAADKLGGIDILIAEFPLAVEAPLADGDAQLESLLERRAALVRALCESALPHLKKSPAGRIISIGFLRSLFAENGSEAFEAAEQDLAALTRKLAAQKGEYGITANYIQPGAIMTPASREVFRKNKALRDFCIQNSAARRLGEPVDVAKVALFLASDDSAFVSGTGIRVDGGNNG
ncbi:MAG: SDR family oxidoreductase [Woeseiaceae bacterium]|nr:SDR family oxidoreductase [Woeseiaceae bacterium]